MRPALRWSLVAALLLVALLAVLGAGIAWSIRSEGGTAWLLARVPGLTVQVPRGALLDGDFAAQRVQWRGGDGTLQLATRKPFALQASVQLHPATGSAPTLPWQATLDARGPLPQLQLTAALRGTAPAGKPAPALDAQATLTPFAAWPIAALSARTKALGLSS